MSGSSACAPGRVWNCLPASNGRVGPPGATKPTASARQLFLFPRFNGGIVITHPTDITRAIKAALHKAFPQAKFSVTRGGSWISWNDGSIERTAVENAILAAGLAEPQKGYDGTRWLRIIESDDSIQFDSPARRAAAQQRNQEYLARQQRENAAIAAAQPKRVRHDVERSVPVTAEQERAGFQAVEDLRLRAEASVASSEERSRRPSWTPPLILEGELLEACRTLNYLGPDEPPIARLWAMFADPKAPGRYAREHDSHHPLPGISCRGFQLHAGGARQPTSNVLFEASAKDLGRGDLVRIYSRRGIAARAPVIGSDSSETVSASRKSSRS